MKCTLANWTDIAYKIPRTELDKCKERDDLNSIWHVRPSLKERCLHKTIWCKKK